MLHPKTDIRSMFNKTPGQNYASAAEPVPPVITAEAVAAVVVVPAEKKKAIKRDEIDVLCDAYYKAYAGEKIKGIINHDMVSVKETLKETDFFPFFCASCHPAYPRRHETLSLSLLIVYF